MFVPILILNLSPEVYAGVAGFIAISVIGIFSRLFWKGFQVTLVKSVLDSSLKEVLANLTGTLTRIENSVSDIQDNQRDARVAARQSNAELDALRQRFDAHISIAAEDSSAFVLFRERVASFMRDHRHETTPAAQPISSTMSDSSHYDQTSSGT